MTKPLSIQTRRTRDLNDAERSAIVALCTDAHQVDFGPLFTYLPPDGLHTLAHVDGRLAGHAVVTTRWLQPGDLPKLKTAYVDAVATLPQLQGRGVGSAVMRHLATELDGYEIACLETEIAPFYTRLGWVEWRGPLAGRKGDELMPTPDQTGIMILRLAATPTLDLNSALVIDYAGRIW